MGKRKDLLQHRLILPHFNRLWILRESVKILLQANRWLDDSSLIKLLNKNNIIRGRDARRARNIYEAALYLGFVKRRTVKGRKFEYTSSTEGVPLAEFSNDFPCSTQELQIFVKSLERFKIPNATQYQEPSRFKEYYQLKRVRPFFVLLKSLQLAQMRNFECDIVTATVPMYANDEGERTIYDLLVEVKSRLKNVDTSRAPFRDALTLLSWGKQLDLLKGEGLYEMTSAGHELLSKLQQETPVWWVDSSIDEFLNLLVLCKLGDYEIREIGVSELQGAISRISKRLSVLRYKGGVDLSNMPLVSLKDDKAMLKSPVSIDVVTDVPFDHQSIIEEELMKTIKLLKTPEMEAHLLRERVKELEAEIARLRKQTVEIPAAPTLEELHLLATLDDSLRTRYGQTGAAMEFEKRVWYIFNLLNYDVQRLGHRTKEVAPDAIVINKYPATLKIGPNEAVFIECKASKQPYDLPRHDIREISDYSEQWFQRCLKEYMAVPQKIFIIAGRFAPHVRSRAQKLEESLLGMKIGFIEAKALASLAKEFLENPVAFDTQAKSRLFKKLLEGRSF